MLDVGVTGGSRDEDCQHDERQLMHCAEAIHILVLRAACQGKQHLRDRMTAQWYG